MAVELLRVCFFPTKRLYFFCTFTLIAFCAFSPTKSQVPHVPRLLHVAHILTPIGEVPQAPRRSHVAQILPYTREVPHVPLLLPALLIHLGVHPGCVRQNNFSSTSSSLQDARYKTQDKPMELMTWLCFLPVPFVCAFVE